MGWKTSLVFALTLTLAACGGEEGPMEPGEEDDPTGGVDGGSWSAVAPLPEPIANPSATTHEGAIWVVGGELDLSSPTASVYRYDPAANQWQSMPDAPEPIFNAGLVVHEGRLLLVGGTVGDNSPSPRSAVWAWDPEGSQWNAHSTLPIPSSAPYVVSLSTGVLAANLGFGNPPPGDSTAFLAVGSDEWRYAEPAPITERRVFVTSVPDSATTAWLIGSESYARYEVGAGWVETGALPATGFTVGSWGLGDELHLAIRLGSVVDHFVLDPDTGEWGSAAGLPRERIRSLAASVTLDGKLYLIGGWNTIEALRSVDVYSPPPSP